MNQYLPIWSKVTFLCLVSALLLGVVNWSVSYKLQKQEKQVFESLLKGWKQDARLGKDLTLGVERSVTSMRFVKSYIPLRGHEGKTELFVVRLVMGGYVGHHMLFAAYTKEGTLVGCLVGRDVVPPVSTYSKPSPALQKVFLEKGRWTYRPNGTDTLQREEIEAIGGATFTFLSLLEALQEGSSFVKGGGRRP